MNLAAVLNAGLLAEGNAVVVTVSRGRLILQYVLPVDAKLLYHLSLGKGVQFTAKSAMPR